MISFPEKYFDTETRCRFTIGKLMKSNWAAQLEVLEVLKGVCTKHNITFFAGFGTLIGAVRHKGYIPWDDDLDVVMKRPDYMRFLSVARSELPSEYQILSMYYEEEWNGSFSRVITGDVISTAREYLRRNHGCPFSVGIDIFPIDYYPQTSQEQTLQWTLLEVVKNNISYCDALLEMENPAGEVAEIYRDALRRGLEMQYEYLGIPVDESRSIANIRNQLFRIYDKICMMYQEEECREIVAFQANIPRLAGRWKKEWFDRAISMGYDVTWIPVPVEYDKVLKATFGDYRNPIYRPGGHDYPYYKMQLEMLQERGMWTLEDGLEAGEYQEYPAWEQVRAEGEKVPVPQEWQRLLQSCAMTDAAGGTDERGVEECEECVADGGCVKDDDESMCLRKKNRKAVLYVTSLTGLLRGEEAYLAKLKTVLETFKMQQDVVLWWIPCETENCLYRQQNPVLFDNYDNLCQEYKKGEWGIFDDSGNLARAVVCADAMYGDYGEVYELFRKSGKPIMIQDEAICV